MDSTLLRSLRFVRRYGHWAAMGVGAVLLSSAADLVAPQLLRRLIDDGVQGGRTDVIVSTSLWLLGTAIIGGAASFAQGYYSARASHGAAFEMREAIFDRLQRLSFAFHDRAQTGQLITRVTSDVDLVRDFVGGGLIQTVSAIILLTGAAVLLLVLDRSLAIVALLVLPVVVAVLFVFIRRLGPLFKEFQVLLSTLNTVLQENVAGARVVRAFSQEDRELARYDDANLALLDQGLVVRRTVANAFPLLFSIGAIGVACVTWVGSVRIVEGTMSVGSLVAFTSYLYLLLQPLFVLGFGAQQIARAGASSERLFEILDAPEDVVEKADALTLDHVEGHIEFDAVHLRYPGADREVLRGVSLNVPAQATVAIVGTTGSGKTSLVNLIPRFYDVTQGSVRIDGTDVRDLTLSSLRGVVGFVMQDPILFSGSVRENIAYGLADASDEAVHAAAVAADADRFIAALPDGYETLIGERGVKLSGGQRQRLSIARAILIDPRILIMDDSTSSVDSRTEASIRTKLESLMADRTTLVVAQRLATARAADMIVVMDQGAVIDVGSHAELMERSCDYAQIAASQLVEGTER